MVDIYCNGGAFLGLIWTMPFWQRSCGITKSRMILFLSNFLMEAEELLERKA